MMAWAWVVIGTIVLIALSLVVGLALGKMLGSIGEAASSLRYESASVSAHRNFRSGVDQAVRRGRQMPLGSQTPEYPPHT
jgi:hypothetical protein